MKVLLFITKPYSFSVLNPIRSYCERENIEVSWFKASSAKSVKVIGSVLTSTNDVMQFEPDAVIVPGNVVPDFWPGLKVQIFHGLGEEKKGHYDITDFFDLAGYIIPISKLVFHLNWPLFLPIFVMDFKPLFT